jgi:DNA-binding beta-propeller fold protein YncE
MKRKLLLLFALASNHFIFSQKIEKMNRVDVDGFYTNPVVSPDGNFALVTGHHFKGAYVLNLKTNEITQISDKEGSGYGYSWDNNNEMVYFKQKEVKEFFSDSKVYSYSLKDKKATLRTDIDINMLSSYHGAAKNAASQIVVYTNMTTLKIEAKDLISKRSWVITSEEGQYYNALLSPDGKKVVVHKGSDIYVYDINGNGKGQKVGTGIATSWSADNQHLLGFLDTSEDGHNVTNSELYLFDIKTLQSKKVTNTEVLLEMFPSFISKNKVLFTDDKTGAIYTANLKM